MSGLAGMLKSLGREDDARAVNYEARQFERQMAEERARALGLMGAPTVRRGGPKIGRNAPCPCGSGKKYKKCCGKVG